ncbi:MAG TPA: hypothetical protein VMW46_05185 [Candidatus Desulfaltia sp.]|nr:hypothetical protein [Candidatus Desulfaltia sp.]
MATYKQIQKWVKESYGFTVKPCWIAHVKEICGLKLRKAPNRLYELKRANPCPPKKLEPIRKALKHFSEI